VTTATAFGVTLGPCDDMRAEVFVRLPPPAAAQGGEPPRLEGVLTGPECRLATTLPATARLVDLGPPPPGAVARDLVARVVLTEPAFWAPELPNRYRLEGRIRAGDAVVGTFGGWVGLRRLGARGRSFRLDGRRWVPRGTRIDGAAFDVADLRSQATVAVMVDPDDGICSRADVEGVAIIAALGADGGGPPAVAEVARRIAAWAAHPAVMLALLPAGMSATDAEAVAAAARAGKGTLQVGWTVDASVPPPAIPPGMDWLAVDVGRDASPHPAWREAPPPLPLVACGAAAGGRAACDALQASLAAWGLAGGGDRVPWEWAGYVVW
jgi:hypothetical protein